jgi:hypothetical protein
MDSQATLWQLGTGRSVVRGHSDGASIKYCMAGQERNSFSEAVRATIHTMPFPNVRQGGYNSPNAARAWAFLTSVVVGDLAIGTSIS